mgnify:CR=1 FL=1
MAWTNKQKMLMAKACRAAGLDDDQRRMILSGLPNARDGRGNVTSTAPKLGQDDFEDAMAVVESATPGQQIAGFTSGHFQRKADDDTERQRRLGGDIEHCLVAAGTVSPTFLQPWIDGHVQGGSGLALEQLARKQLSDLINGLRAFARRHGVELPDRASKQRRSA